MNTQTSYNQVADEYTCRFCDEMKAWMVTAGFSLQEAIERDPYPEVEYPRRRAYLFSQKA